MALTMPADMTVAVLAAIATKRHWNEMCDASTDPDSSREAHTARHEAADAHAQSVRKVNTALAAWIASEAHNG